MTKNENDPVSFRCAVSSKPASLIKIEHNSVVVKMTVTDSLELVYSKPRSKCEDAGVYRCLAANEYNENEAVSMEVRYYVRCKYHSAQQSTNK